MNFQADRKISRFSKLKGTVSATELTVMKDETNPQYTKSLAGSTKILSELLKKYNNNSGVIQDNKNTQLDATRSGNHLKSKAAAYVEDTLDDSKATWPDDDLDPIGSMAPVPVLNIKVPHSLNHLYSKKIDDSSEERKAEKRSNKEPQLAVEKRPRVIYNIDDLQDEARDFIESHSITKKHETSITIEISEEDLIQEFFEDNKTRYPEDTTEADVLTEAVPILPIKVPSHLRRLYDKRSNNKELRQGTKRPSDENLPVVEKKIRHTQECLPRNDTSQLDLQMYKETKTFKVEKESKAKQSMLQTTQNMKENQWNNQLLVAEYAGEIFDHLYDKESEYMANPFYALLPEQTVSWKVRDVLVDWIAEAHDLLGFSPETLFLAVNITDRFLSIRSVSSTKISLVGIASLSLASKFEDTRVYSMYNFLHLTNSAFTDDELVKAEQFILNSLNFKLCYPNPHNFLSRICTDEFKCDINSRIVAQYILEASCMDHAFIGTRPSKIAAASLWLAKKMLKQGKWTARQSNLAGYTPKDMKLTVEALLSFFSGPIRHGSFFDKWASPDLYHASYFVRDWTNRYYDDQ